MRLGCRGAEKIGLIVEVFANDDWLRGHGRELPASFL